MDNEPKKTFKPLMMRSQEGLTWIKSGPREMARTESGYTLFVVKRENDYLAGFESPTGSVAHSSAETWREARWMAKVLADMDENPITAEDILKATEPLHGASIRKAAFAVLVVLACAAVASIAHTLSEIFRGVW